MVRVALMTLLAACEFQRGSYTLTSDGAVDGSSLTEDMALVDAPPRPLMYVQDDSETVSGSGNLVADDFPEAQTAGNANIVVISWSDGGDNVMSVTDTNGNAYSAATNEISNAAFTMHIYYATNIKGGGNTITVQLSGSAPSPKLRIFEYAGVATTSAVQGYSSGSGTGSTTSQVAPLSVTSGTYLLFAANVVSTVTSGPGPDFTARQIDNGDIVMDRVITQVGSYGASAPLTQTSSWVMQLVAFKAQ